MKRTGTIDERYPVDYADLWDLVKRVQSYTKSFAPFELRENPDDLACMTLTVGFNRTDYGYQAGDNSFTGGAYGYPHWAVTYVPRTGPLGYCVEDLAEQIRETWEDID